MISNLVIYSLLEGYYMSKEKKDRKSDEMVVTPWEVSGTIDYK